MRFLYGILAGWLWVFMLAFAYSKGVEISNDVVLISSAIVVAGAMAGGD